MNLVLAEKLADFVELGPKEYEAFCEIDRKYFVPIGFQHKAYEISAIPLSEHSTISSPLTVAKMTYYLKLNNVDSVLEIGCGSGYQAAILSKIVRRVFTVDRICPLIEKAKQKFKNLKLFNINAKCDDGREGWKTYAPYDRILLSAYADNIEKKIFSQIKEDGFVLAPVKYKNEQIITRLYKNGKIEKLEKCEFVPIKQGLKKY